VVVSLFGLEDFNVLVTLALLPIYGSPFLVDHLAVSQGAKNGRG
jgi:hypothetical protein